MVQSRKFRVNSVFGQKFHPIISERLSFGSANVEEVEAGMGPGYGLFGPVTHSGYLGMVHFGAR